MNNQPIGVIDSGVGGLTILKQLITAFPHESFVYYGDTKHAPYGEKDIPTLKELTENMVRFMEEKRVKILIIACNTITASGVLKQIDTTIPLIIEIIEPTVRYTAEKSPTKHITLLATEVTIRSGIYERLLKQFLPHATVQTFPLPQLVISAEKGEFETEEVRYAIQNIAAQIPPHSTVILGCTHYPFFTPVFRKYLDPTIRMVDSSQAVVEEISRLVSPTNTTPRLEYHVSGDTSILDRILKQYLDSSDQRT